MSRRPVRRLSAAAVSVLALGSFAACGSDDAQPASSDTVSSASPNAGDVAATEGPIEPSELVEVLKAAFDDATTASISVTSQGALPLSADGVVDLTGDTPAASVSFSAFGQEQEIIALDGVLYTGTGDGRFVKIDPAKLAGQAGQGGDDGQAESPFGGMSDLDPQALLGALDSDAVDAQSLGSEDVDGESMDHYQVSVDPNELLAGLGEAGGAGDEGSSGAGSALGGLSSMLPDEVTVDFLIDEEGLLRSVDLGLGDQAGHIIATFDDWGDPVDISAPPASKIDKAPKLPGGLGGLGGLGALDESDSITG